jgi:hypothetical protein
MEDRILKIWRAINCLVKNNKRFVDPASSRQGFCLEMAKFWSGRVQCYRKSNSCFRLVMSILPRQNTGMVTQHLGCLGEQFDDIFE